MICVIFAPFFHPHFFLSLLFPLVFCTIFYLIFEITSYYFLIVPFVMPGGSPQRWSIFPPRLWFLILRSSSATIGFSVRIHRACVMETSLLKLHGEACGFSGPWQNLNSSLRILVLHTWLISPHALSGLELCLGGRQVKMVQLTVF